MKTVLITGCSSGIGLLTAKLFADKGYTVYAGMRQKKEIDDKIKSIELDVTNDERVKEAVATVIKNEGKIDVLVNNAGFGFVGPIEAFSLEEIKTQFETNVWGGFRLIKEVMPYMRTKNRGVILNLSSINGLIAFPLWGVYSASKFAIEAMTEALRFEAEPFGIKVALVEPGSFNTNFPKNRKMPRSLNEADSPYKELVTRFFKKFDAMKGPVSKSPILQSWFNPQRVADRIVEIAEEEDPKLHNRIGIDAHVYYWAKRWLPDFVWQYVLKRTYKK
jgi:NAD(P)-dependent dehydrogenase (short-subunit alcohol dehydrogenase family)